jgi:hypothetical protein
MLGDLSELRVLCLANNSFRGESTERAFSLCVCAFAYLRLQRCDHETGMLS